MGEDVRITYETLFDLLRVEKNREELQKLDSSFYNDTMEYLSEKKAALEASLKRGNNLDAEKAHAQLQNIKRLIKGIYEKREKKVFQMALNSVKIGTDIIDTGVMLENEKQLFRDLINLLSKHRESMLGRIDSDEPGFIEHMQRHVNAAQERPAVAQPESTIVIDAKKTIINDDEEEDDRHDNTSRPEEQETEPLVRIRFLASIPKFLGKGLEVYGPFGHNDEGALPESIANILIQKNKAEKV